MPTKRQPASAEVIDPNDPEWRAPAGNLLPEAIEDEAETGLDRVLTQIRGSGDDKAKVKLYRLRDGKENWCKDFSIAEFEKGAFEMVRERFGPGDYMIRVYGINPNGGRTALMARESFTLEPDEGWRGNNPAPSPSGLEAVLQAMVANQQRFQESIVAALSARPDPMAQMKDTLGLMVVMREAMGLTGGQQGNPLKDTIEAIKMLRETAKEILPENEAPKSEMATMLEALTPIAAIVKETMENRRNPALPAPGSAMPTLSVPASISVAPQPAVAPVNPTAQDVEVNFRNLSEEQKMQLLQELVPVVNHLATLATQNVPPKKGAEYLYDILPDEVLDLIDETPQWFEMLSGMFPILKPHEIWIKEAIKLLDEVEKEDELQSQLPLENMATPPKTGDLPPAAG